jgi:hypothetical protein
MSLPTVFDGTLTVSVGLNPATPPGCGPLMCDEVFSVDIPYVAFTGGVDCELNHNTLAYLISDFLNGRAEEVLGEGLFCANQINCPTDALLGVPSVVLIESTFDFILCISADEMNLASGNSLPLIEGCPINNIANGTDGDESGASVSGLNLVLTDAECPVPTPTPTCDPAAPFCEAATITITATDGLVPGGFTFIVSIPPATGPIGCAPTNDYGTELGRCDIDCTNLVTLLSSGFLQSATDVANQVASDLAACLNASFGDILSATALSVGDVCITSASHLLFSVCGSEFTDCSSGFVNPLSDNCSLVNICDGVSANEEPLLFNHTAALAINYSNKIIIDHPTPTPTCDPAAPACEAATITLSCTGDPSIFSGSFTFTVTLPPPVLPLTCAPTDCGNPLATCVIDCSNAPMLPDCTSVVIYAADQLAACLNAQLGGPGGLLQAIPQGDGSICILAYTHLSYCACGSEFVDCGSGQGIPIDRPCPLVNLCDGVNGNEGPSFEFDSGLAINYDGKEIPATPTPTPTCDPASSFCESATITVGCAGDPSTHSGTFDFIVSIPPDLRPVTCSAPVECGTELARCTIDCDPPMGNEGLLPDCTAAIVYIADQIAGCLNNQLGGPGGILIAIPTGDGRICIMSTQHLSYCVCGPEFTGCTPGMAYPLDGPMPCPVVNLCDGIDDNQAPVFPFDNGISLNYEDKETPPDPTPTPTCDPAQPICESATITFSCTGDFLTHTGSFDIIVGEAPLFRPVTCSVPVDCGSELARCTVDCDLLPGFPIIQDCEDVANTIAELVSDCLNMQLGGPGGILMAMPVGNGRVCITSTQHLSYCVCGPEMPGCGGSMAYPLDGVDPCPVLNLCDGINGNEAPPFGFTNGIAINYEDKAPPATPTPTPTCNPADVFCRGATITIGCMGDQLEDGEFRIQVGLPRLTQPASCVPVPCPDVPLVDCVIDCTALNSDSTITDCTGLVTAAAAQLITCLNASSGGVIDATQVRAGVICVFMTQPLSFCVCGDEFVPCSSGLGIPIDLPGCGLVNLCDGTEGNEGPSFTFTGGLSLQYEVKPLGDPTPTPTATASQTPGGPTATETPVGPTATATPDGPTATATATPDGPTATATPAVCDSGYYLLDSLGGRHRVGNPIIISGPLYFGVDIARDMERLVCNQGAAPNEDLYVLDGFGGTHIVQNQLCSIVQEFYFGETPGIPRGRAVDIEMSADGQGFWVLADHGGIYRAGSTKEALEPALVPNTMTGTLGYDMPITGEMRDPNLPDPGGASLRAVSFIVIDMDLNSRADGYVVMDSMGGRLHWDGGGNSIPPNISGGEPANSPLYLLDPIGYVWPFFVGLDIARDMELHPTQQGVVILDGWDGIHPVPVLEESNPVFFAHNLVSATDSTPLQAVGLPYVQTGFDDPNTTPEDEGDPSAFGIDAASIFRDLEFSAGCPNSGLYTLDRFGGVFALGDARASEMEPIPPFTGSPYFFPLLYAEDIEVFAANEAETTFDQVD